MLKDAPILILDEPTEGLDSPTANALMNTLDKLTRHRSVLLITHRPEGIASIDEILALRRGRIVARNRTSGGPTRATGWPTPNITDA
jgi:ATP-binding cassette subfamily C protein CydC